MAQYHWNNVDSKLMRAGKIRAASMGITFRALLILALERFADPEAVTQAWSEKGPHKPRPPISERDESSLCGLTLIEYTNAFENLVRRELSDELATLQEENRCLRKLSRNITKP